MTATLQASRAASRVVGVGDMALGAGANTLATHALGSCVAVCCWDASTRNGFLLHLMLPDSKLDPRRADKRPFMFADTGLELSIQQLLAQGANRAQLKVKLAGGAAGTVAKVGSIGKRNVLAVRKWLWRQSIPILGEEVLGSISRTVHFHPSTGRLEISTPGRPPRVL